MFDMRELASFENAPQLRELSPPQISRLVTQAAVIVKASGREEGLNGSSPELRSTLIRLARTMETLVAVRPERDNVRSAAFVAALAHRALRESYGESWRVPTLTTESVSPALATAVLFAIGESPGDAYALAKELAETDTSEISGLATRMVASLLTGNLVEIIDGELPGIPPGMDLDAAAEFQLYRDLVNYLISIARRYSPVSQQKYWPVTLEDLREAARRITQAAHYEFNISTNEGDAHPLRASSDYPGIANLAGLLAILVEGLEETSVVVKWPAGNFAEVGLEAQSRVMAKRPFLWPNHIAALEKGVLNSNVSAIVTYPTGSGKSTIIEMRIALGIDEGKSTVILVPTNSLVQQTKQNLSNLFPDCVREDVNTENDLPSIYVLTPEKYLIVRTELHLNADVGQMIFDEFHLMHSQSGQKDRRALDAMLSLVLYIRDVPDGSVMLLSALVKNGSQLADWIASVTGRTCLNLDDRWRPNRQLRGMVAYDSNELSMVSQALWDVRRNKPDVGLPKEAKEAATAVPFALFGIQRTWSGDPKDLVISKLLDRPVPLGLGKPRRKDVLWHFTANANVVAAAIVGNIASEGLKAIVFAQTIPSAHSVAKILNSNVPQFFDTPTREESVWLKDLTLEFGSTDELYVSVDSEGRFNRAAVSHHGLLLVQERLLHESLYKRDGGVNVLVATSTIAQGMNLPADLVVIAGDARYNLQTSEYSRIAAPELLNAAGRAGRAGTSDTGTVLIIPSSPLQFDGALVPDSTARLFARIYSEDDASLDLEDPFARLLSSDVEDESVHELAYVAGRISGTYQATDYGAGSTIDSVLSVMRLSFGAQARNPTDFAGDLVRVSERLQALNNSGAVDMTSLPGEVIEVAAANGVNAESLAALMNSLGHRNSAASLVETLRSIKESIGAIDRPGDLLPPWLHSGEPREASDGDLEVGTYENQRLFQENEWTALFAWIEGKTIREIEEILVAEGKKPTPECRAARRFVLHRVADFAFFVSLPASVWQLQLGDMADPILGRLETLVRQGFDDPGKLDLWAAEGRVRMRVWCHKRFAEYEPWIDVYR